LQLDRNDKVSILSTAFEMADAGRPIALNYFRNNNQIVENKLANGFDPVTVADKEIELIFRKILSERRPQDGILGEEFPDVIGVSGLTWVLDPIDGTRGFISGTPTWGMLIGVNDGTQPVFGIIDQPFTAERFIGGFGQSVLQHNGHEQALKVRSCTSLQNAVLFSTMPEVGTEAETKLFNSVSQKCKLTRYGMDCYAYALLAAGQIDLVIEAQLNPYDIQGPLAVVQAAGGIVTNWQGGAADQGGQVIAAGDPTIHAAAMKILNM
jgi:histidinol phosphatase-like enzyme (inositol monophosphatase family)|tara:strand:- start:15328 stop:16125 length:798 start_codon:yes stop_codon:yes gene_type:complete